MRHNDRWLNSKSHQRPQPFRNQSLLPMVIAAVMISVFAINQTPAVHSFFQSPQEQPTNTPVPPPTNTPVPPPTNTPEPPPTQPPAEEQPINTPEPVEAPTETPVPPTEPQATDTPVPPQPIEQNPPNPEPQQQAPAAGAQPQPVDSADPATLDQPVEDSSGLVINQVELIDTAVQWFAWLWLCLGVGAVLLVPLFFLYIQIRGVRATR